MTECSNCEETIHEPGYFELDDHDGPLCRGCYRRLNGRTRRHRSYVSPDDYERNAEAIEHKNKRDRQRIIDNAVNQQ